MVELENEEPSPVFTKSAVITPGESMQLYFLCSAQADNRTLPRQLAAAGKRAQGEKAKK